MSTELEKLRERVDPTDTELIAALVETIDEPVTLSQVRAKVDDVLVELSQISESHRAWQAQRDRERQVRASAKARWLDERKQYRRHPLLLAMDKARTINLSHTTETKSPRQERADDMAAQLRAIRGR